MSGRLDDYPRRARLRDRCTLTPTGTVRLTFDIVDGDPLDAEPGQFIGVAIEVRGARRAKTPYCILGCTDDRLSFDLLVRVVPDGPVSLELGTMRPGREIEFRGPLGRPMLPRDPTRDIVLLATGVGVSPFIFLVDALATGGHSASVRLFWGVRLEEDLCLTDELDRLARAHVDFTWVATLSQPSSDWRGLRGRLTESVPPLLHRVEDVSFCFCGNGAMSEEMMAALGTVGVSQRRMHDEPFFNRRHRASGSVVREIVDRFPPAVRRHAMPSEPDQLFPLDRPLTAQRSLR